jgi:fructose transport system permease protein
MTRRQLASFGPALALFGACLLFATQSPRFLTLDNASLITQQVMVVGVLAIGQTLVILTAGIDLSCGMLMALGSVITTMLAGPAGLSPILAMLVGLGVTTSAGLLNGLLVTRVSLPPFIVTLGTMNIAFALTQILSRSQSITELPPLLTALGRMIPLFGTGIAYGVVVMLLLYLLAWWLLRETAGGRHVYAVGNHPETARLVGIDTQRVLVVVYTVAGALYGVAALLLIGRTGVGDPQAGQTENLDAITAVVLGGTSLFGGRGIVLGSLIGALIVGVFRNGLTLMGIPSVYQILVTGVLVILAVATDQWSRRSA